MWHILFAEIQRQSIYPLVQGVTSITWIDASGKLNCSHRFFPKVEVAFAPAPKEGKTSLLLFKISSAAKIRNLSQLPKLLGGKILYQCPIRICSPATKGQMLTFSWDIWYNWKWRLEHQLLIIPRPSLSPARMHQTLSHHCFRHSCYSCGNLCAVEEQSWVPIRQDFK